MAKVKLNLRKQTLGAKLQQATTIKNQMTGNPNFPNPTPSLAEYGALIDAAAARHAEWIAVQQNAKLITTRRQEAFAAMDAATVQMGAFVDSYSGGDAVKIRSAGMDVRAEGSRLGAPGEVMNVVLQEGPAPETLKVSWDRQRGSRVYELEVCAGSPTNGNWRNWGVATKHSKTLEGLTSGTKVWVRVRGIGAAGPGPWSDPATKVVP